MWADYLLLSTTSQSTSDSCTCHYIGKLTDGSVFDSSVQRGKPATFSPGGVIGGWTEALMLMRPGDKWILTIPSDLAYGDRGSGSKIPGGAALVFELELIAVKPASWQDWVTVQSGLFASLVLYQLYSLFGGGGASPETKAFSETFLSDNKVKEGVITLRSGLQYKVLRAGDGDSHPLPNSPCKLVVFEQIILLEVATGSHACSLEASMHVINSMPLGSPCTYQYHHKFCGNTKR
jgi:hypothetical protein